MKQSNTSEVAFTPWDKEVGKIYGPRTRGFLGELVVHCFLLHFVLLKLKVLRAGFVVHHVHYIVLRPSELASWFRTIHRTTLSMDWYIR